MSVNVDIEVTNRCNADCFFCPRDQTPHEGLMTQEIFDQVFARVVELRDGMAERDPEGAAGLTVSLTGLGEPLVNPRVAAWGRTVTDAGFTCVVSSNGSLLDERRGQAIIDSGVKTVWLNVGAIGETYEEVYKLPWQRTYDNVVRFAKMSEGLCDTYIVLVNFRQDPAYTQMLKDFWGERGIKRLVEFDILNRGGSLFVDHMQYEAFPQQQEARRLLDERGGRLICMTPFIYVFIGYDGKYYLCCSDWKKEVSFGSVFDQSIVGITRAKLEHVVNRGAVCRTCNFDPLNHLTGEMRAADLDGSRSFDAAALATELAESSRNLEVGLEKAVPGVTEGLPGTTPTAPRRRHRLIPVFGR